MAFKVIALVGNTSTTTGTGDIFVGGALPAPFRSLAILNDGDTFPYCIRDNVNFECGLGTWHAGTVSFTRTRVDQSSNSNVAVNWASGTRNVFCDYGTAMFLYQPNNGSDIANAGAFRTNLGLGSAAVQNAGTSGANVCLQLDGSGKIPAVDGSQITGLPANPIPSGTKMPFYQAAAPAGWTLITTISDCLIGISKGAGDPNGAGGTQQGISWDVSFGLSCAPTVAGHSLVLNELPAGTLVLTGGGGSVASPGAGTSIVQAAVAAAHTHTATAAMSSPSTWRPPMAMFIICSKN